MEQRRLGRTGLSVSVIGFGCGMVGGLMVGGTPSEQEAAVAHALDAGITYFDTAPFYGAGKSEENLGRALRSLKRRAIVGSKVRIDPALRDDLDQRDKLPALITRSVEESLRRLGVDCLDLIQLHNPISPVGTGSGLTVDLVRQTVLGTFERLRRDGKVRFAGLSALGHAPGVIDLLQDDRVDTVQVAYSLLNPSANEPLDDASPSENYERLLRPVGEHDIGVIGIRLLAGGSLSGVSERHPNAMTTVIPLGKGIGSGADYEHDVACAHQFGDLVREGLARSLASAALRYGISTTGMHTLAIGFSSREQLEEAVQAAEDGRFDAPAMQRIRDTQVRLGLVAASEEA